MQKRRTSRRARGQRSSGWEGHKCCRVRLWTISRGLSRGQTYREIHRSGRGKARTKPVIASLSSIEPGSNQATGSVCSGTRLLFLALAASGLVSCRVSTVPTTPVDGPSTLRYLAGSWTQVQSSAADGGQETGAHVVYQLSPSSHRLLEERDAHWKYSGVILWNPASCVFVRYAMYETAIPGTVNASAWTGTLDVPGGMILWRGTNGLPALIWHLHPPDEIEIREPDRNDPWNASKGRWIAQYVRDGHGTRLE